MNRTEQKIGKASMFLNLSTCCRSWSLRRKVAVNFAPIISNTYEWYFQRYFKRYFPNIFLPTAVPLKSTVDGLSITDGNFGSLFQAIFLAKHANKCFDKFFSSLQKMDKKGKTVIERRTCWKWGKYHSTIKAMTAHKRLCGNESDKDDDDLVILG